MMMGSRLSLSSFLLILACIFSLSQCDQFHSNEASTVFKITPFGLGNDGLLGFTNDDDNKTKNKRKGHKGLLPLNESDFLAFTFEALVLVVAAGGGIGGGGMLVPIYSLVLGFRPKHAIPLANVSVLGGAVANVLLNWSKRHPFANRPLIDWDLILLMQPPIIAGSLIGAIINKLIPEFILVIMLVIILLITAYKTLSKGKLLYQRENEETRLTNHTSDEELDGTIQTFESSDSPFASESSVHHFEPETNTAYVESKVSSSTPLLDEELTTDANNPAQPYSEVNREDSTSSIVNEILVSESRTPIIIVLAIVQLFIVVIALNILKGGGAAPSPLGIQCGSIGFWVVQGFMLVWIVSMTLIARHHLLKCTKFKKEVNYPFRADDIVWDSKATLVYPLLCGIAGLCAGMFGIGGGIIIGPIMLALEVHPLVVSATSATMNLFTSFTVTTSYIVFGLLASNYAFVVAIIAFFATVVGQLITNVVLKRTGRYSYISFIIGFTVLLSAILMSIQAMSPIQEANQNRETGRICTKDV